MVKLAFFEAGRSDGPALVLGHALGADHRMWDEVTAILAPHFRVLRWDQPGHGQSSLLGQPGPSRRTMDEVVGALLDGLNNRGVGSAHFAGISLGGLVSLAVAETAPDRAESLSILDTGASLKPASAWIERAALVRDSGLEPLVDPTMNRWFSADCRGDGYRRTRATFESCDPEGYAQCCEVIADTDLSDGLGALRMPTMILTGSDDPGMTPEQAVELAHQIPGATEPVIIQGSGHITCVHDPKSVAKAIRVVAG